MDNPLNIRPPIVLNFTMKYLIDVVIDQDLVPPGKSFFSYMNDYSAEATHPFMNIYSFLKDRTRQISQDMSIANLPPNNHSIECLESIVRYLVISQHDGISEKDFDVYTNLK